MLTLSVSPQLIEVVNSLKDDLKNKKGITLLESLSAIEQRAVKKIVVDKVVATPADVQWF